MGDSAIIARRLREARLRKRLTQERLGLLAGVDEFTASTRINQYEREKHVPSFPVIKRLAEVLDVPAEWFYLEDDAQAQTVLRYHQLSPAAQAEVRATVDRLWADESVAREDATGG